MKIKVCFLSVVLVALLVVPAQAAPEIANTVEVRPVSFEEIMAVSSSEQLDALLYPTVTELPTKYVDLYMFADTGLTSTSISYEARDLLETYYPSDDGKYTWAELYATQLYVAWYGELYGNKREDVDAADLVALREMTEVASVFVGDPMTTAGLTDIDTLKSVLSDYESVLNGSDASGELYQQMCQVDEETGVVLSIGREHFWRCTGFTTPIGLDMQDVVKWYETRPAYMGLFGIQSEVATRVFHPDGQAATSTVEGEAGASLVIEERTVDEDVLPIPKNFSSNGYVGDFDTPIMQADLPDGTTGIRDILLTVAIVLTILCVIAFAVVDFIRKWNDPMRKWRWPRW